MKFCTVYITKKKCDCLKWKTCSLAVPALKNVVPIALMQIGVESVRETLEHQNPTKMDCQFCSTQYTFTAEEALAYLSKP